MHRIIVKQVNKTQHIQHKTAIIAYKPSEAHKIMLDLHVITYHIPRFFNFTQGNVIALVTYNA